MIKAPQYSLTKGWRARASASAAAHSGPLARVPVLCPQQGLGFKVYLDPTEPPLLGLLIMISYISP